MEVNGHYKTLVSGLRLNHPRNVAFAYPLAFILRRLTIVATLYVFLGHYSSGMPALALLAFACTTLAAMVFTVSEWQWSQRAVNY